jgi:hypothetical protein
MHVVVIISINSIHKLLFMNLCGLDSLSLEIIAKQSMKHIFLRT